MSRTAIVAELGLCPEVDDDVIRGSVEVFEELCVPSTPVLRTSVIATWADMVTGHVAGQAVDPRIPLTLDLEVQLQGHAFVGTVVDMVATAVKVGRNVTVTEGRFTDHATGAPIAVALATFIASPDPAHVWADGFPGMVWQSANLRIPFAERAGCVRVEPGTAEVPRREDGLNASGAIQGGIVALVAEEAAASLSPEPVVLESLTLRYLRQFTVGPARAVASGDERFSVVHLTDVGSDRLGAVATARTARLAST